MIVIEKNNKANIDITKLQDAIDNKLYRFSKNRAIRGVDKPPVYQIQNSFGDKSDYAYCSECGYTFSFYEDKGIVEYHAYSEGGMCGLVFNENALNDTSIYEYERDCMKEMINVYKSLVENKILVNVVHH